MDVTPFGDLPLFADPGEPPFLSNPVTELERRFAEFHRNNPEVYKAIEKKALDLVNVGERRRIGIAAIIEELRYDARIQTTTSAPRLNNSHRAFYARLLIHNHSALASVIGVRRQTHYEGAA